MEVEHLKKDRSKNILKLQEMKKEMNGKEFEHVKTIQKLAKEMGSMKDQVCELILLTDWLTWKTRLYLQQYLLLVRIRFVRLLTSLFPSNLEVHFTGPPS